MLNLDKTTMLDLNDLTERMYDIAERYDPRYPQLPSDKDVESYCEVKRMFFSDKDCNWFAKILRSHFDIRSHYSESANTYTLYDASDKDHAVVVADISLDETERFGEIRDTFNDLIGLRNIMRDQISGVARYVVKLFIGRSMDFYKEKAQRRDLHDLMTKIVDLYRKCDFEDVDENVDYIYGVLTTYRYAYGHDFYEDAQNQSVESVKKSAPDLKDLRKRRGTARPNVK